ncbi:hypothetical protein [Agromyces humatus]|uniref:Uncharacterized protein n=1 Tax=Agromyces humatus TaxID=279573 RepID=A0ABP4X0Z7_9MICO|nr:hypothetical protein [Agromyces humatus]
MGPLELDELIDQVVAEEVASLRASFLDGAEFAVTNMQSPRQRLLHRLECTVLEPYLDRSAQWTEARRSRLSTDARYRPALPTLITREAARQLTVVRSCKVCWPNIHGRDPAPLRRLRAGGLRDSHGGRILSTEAGESLGAIARVSARTGPDLFGRPADAIEVVTSSRVFTYAPTEHVFLWNLPTDATVIERKMRLFQRLGSDLTPAR